MYLKIYQVIEKAEAHVPFGRPRHLRVSGRGRLRDNRDRQKLLHLAQQ